jgi:hypothetical protein
MVRHSLEKVDQERIDHVGLLGVRIVARVGDRLDAGVELPADPLCFLVRVRCKRSSKTAAPLMRF